MSNITCVLDACSIINLIHIDEDETLLKRLKHLNILICQCVFKEVNSNVYKRLYLDQTISTIEINEQRKIIDQKINLFRHYQILDDNITKDLGKDIFSQVKEMSNYKKDNGEFFSSVLCLYKSRFEPTKLFFHTDDFPAKEEFSSFYKSQQIGCIEDTADLLLLLYRLDDDFKENELDELLSKLQSQYTSQVSELAKKLQSYKIPPKLLRDLDYRKNISILIRELNNYKLDSIQEIKKFFFSRVKRYKGVCSLLESFDLISDLGGTDNLVSKIIRIRKELRLQPVYTL